VAFDADLSIRRAIDRFLRHHDVHVSVALEFDNIENIKRAVEIPSGVAILPSRPWRARSPPAPWWPSGSNPRTGAPPDPAAGDHPPAQPPARADRIALPRAADVRVAVAERRRRRGRAMSGAGTAGRRPAPTPIGRRPSWNPDREWTDQSRILRRFEPLVRSAKDGSS
jgi:hypothetical protein